MVEASKNNTTIREFASGHNFDESLIRLWRKNEPKTRESLEKELIFRLKFAIFGRKKKRQSAME